MNIEKNNQKVERIIRWRESLATMPDERFFEIIRTYLGEIHTPYNKDRLIEQLSSIFRKEQTKKTIISFLSPFDIKILSAISAIPNMNQDKIISFFSIEYSLSEIYSELLNLNERLLIFSCKNEEINDFCIFINPLVEDIFTPFININSLFPKTECIQKNIDSLFELSPQFIASFIAYVESYPDMCKNDVSIKKKDIERLEQIFPGKIKCISLLLTAFINLGIIKLGEKEITVDEKHLEKFSELSEFKQYAYISTASVAHLSRENLRAQTQLLLDVAATIPTEGFTKASLIRTAFLLNNKKNLTEDFPAQGRFAKLLEERTKILDNTEKLSTSIIENNIDSAIEFGLFQLYGKDESGNKIYIKSELLSDSKKIYPKKGLLNINAGTNITIMPGLNLSELLPLISFLNIVSFNTVIEFEINRKSISRAFDKNITPAQIFNLLSEYSAFEIPQNLRMNIEDWFNSYSSAILYKGYVLKVDEKSSRFVEKNPKIASFIQLKLAPGIYLMNIPLEDNAEEFIQSSGLDFMGNVKTSKQFDNAIDYPVIREGKSFTLETSESDVQKDNLINIQKTNEIKKNFHEYLNQLDLSDQQKECLASRIDRNIIITEEQLKPETVRLEILEIDGMNYAGKIRLIETAISSGDSIELTIPADNNSSRLLTYLGKPLMVSKHTNDALVRMQLDPDKEIRFFSISKATTIKLIKTSIFQHKID